MIEIKSRWETGKALYTAKGTTDVRAALREAVKARADLSGADLSWAHLSGADLSGADLSGADLSRADLSGADLSWAHLSGADLSWAHLSGADLSWADLSGADLSWAHLSGADLSGADLSGADLSRADLSRADLSRANLSRAHLSRAHLSGAHLSGANLSGADLSGANLSGADLSRAHGIVPERVNDLLLLLDQPGKVRAYKLVNEHGVGPFNGGITYKVGESYEVKNASTDVRAQCAAGINVATLPWCLQNWRPGFRVLVVEFTRKDIAAIPVGDGKFRLHRCKVVAEKKLDLVALGLVRIESEAKAT